MRQSQLFTKTRREAPKDEVARNAELLIRAGYIHKEMAGVYDYLPLGLRVLNRIVQIIREEMNAIGGQELYLTALQGRDIWEKTDRWSDENVDNWFKTALKNGTELGLGFTHEEPLTVMMKDHVRSFRDLPFSVYQFQTKFRNEARAKSGIMRGREFLMKDLYSFNRDSSTHDKFYGEAKKAYIKIFDRLGIGDKTYVTFASGGSFSKYSHEFQTLTEAGEDIIYVYNGKEKREKFAINKEVFTDEVLKDMGFDMGAEEALKRGIFEAKKAVEVGNIFSLGTRFSEALGLLFKDEDGKSKPVIMGSYGIGPGRVMGTIVELLSDDKGIIWPDNIAPFNIHLILIDDKGGKVRKSADALYEKLVKQGIEVLYDDRDESAGMKFSDADLLGIPIRYVISEKTLAADSIEEKDRKTGKVEMKKI